MNLPRSVAEVLRDHVTLQLEGIDRMYLNAYVPMLQTEGGVAYFFRQQHHKPFVSGAVMAPIGEAFVKQVEDFAKRNNVEVLRFERHQRKDDVAKERLARFAANEGVLFIGKAQEKTSVFRTQRRHDAVTGLPYPWLYRSTAMVNQVYFYCVDDDFGPFFLKYSTYFPYTGRLCLNGHEYLKRQLHKRGVAYEALDNGVQSCADPALAQRICDELSAERIEALFRKWQRRLPRPLSDDDRQAGYDHRLSILQAEFSLTQVLDRPLSGRIFFEEVIRENLDVGRPDQVQLIFGRRVTRRTPGRFRTRVITEGVTPSLHVDYKHTRIKEYHKEGRALRTETTINDTRDFGIGKRLINLPALREVGFQANRRLLDVQRLSHDCSIGEQAIERVCRPVLVRGQRASALRFWDPATQALFHLLVLMRLLPNGFYCGDARESLARLLGESPSSLTQGRMTYQLRRLRLHGLIYRVPKSHRYRVTPEGLRTALFFTRVHDRILRPGLSRVMPTAPPADDALMLAFDRLDAAIIRWCEEAPVGAVAVDS